MAFVWTQTSLWVITGDACCFYLIPDVQLALETQVSAGFQEVMWLFCRDYDAGAISMH
jgi:hypothetical protein